MKRDSSIPLLHQQFSLYLGVPFSILGIIGNIIGAIAWRRLCKIHSGSAKNASVYLVAFSVINSILLTCFLTYEGVPEIWPKLKGNIVFVRYYCFIGYPLYSFLVLASIWILVGMIFNRFIMVVHPSKTDTFNSAAVTRIVIACIGLVMFLLSIPHFFTKRPHVLSNGTALVVDSPYGNTKSAERYETWGHSMVFVITPWIIILVLSVIIVRNILLRTRKQKHKKSGSRRMEYRTTIAVLSITCSFLVLFLWEWITSCFWIFKFKSGNSKIWTMVSDAYAPARLGIVINSSLTFFILCLSSSVFRKELCRMFCHWGMRSYKLFSHSDTTLAKQRKKKKKQLHPGYDNGVVVEDNDHYDNNGGVDDDESESGSDEFEEIDEKQSEPIHQIS